MLAGTMSSHDDIGEEELMGENSSNQSRNRPSSTSVISGGVKLPAVAGASSNGRPKSEPDGSIS